MANLHKLLQNIITQIDDILVDVQHKHSSSVYIIVSIIYLFLLLVG